MKTNTKLGLLAFGSCTLAFFVVLATIHADEKTVYLGQESDAKKLISGYHAWKKANDKPVLMSVRIGQLCAPQSPAFIKAHTDDPHTEKYFTVFVNPVGEQEFFTKLNPHFPEGTIIVKQKSSESNSVPELLTMMVKRQDGFDTANGNWEYMTFDGKGSKLLSKGKIKTCQECHEMQSADDYVFRDYLSNAIRAK